MNNYWEKCKEYATEVGNIHDDYITALDTSYQCIKDWEDNYNTLIELQSKSIRNQKKEKQASVDLKSSTSDGRII